MDLIETKAHAGIDRWSTPAALFAATCSMLVLFFLNWQMYLEQTPARPLLVDYPLVISECIFSAPLLVVVILRRSVAITLIYSPILFLILIGRIYYLARAYFFGREGSLQQNFDVPGTLLILLGVVSLGIVVLWVAFRLAMSIRAAVVYRVRRIRGR
jgi:hypothetical protein